MANQKKTNFSQNKTITLPIEGMSCASCVGRVENAFKKVPGVKQVSVNLATEQVQLVLDDQVKRTDLANAVEKAGYAIANTQIELALDGMSCASCVNRIEKALRAVPGVSSANVNLATERASILSSTSVDTLIAAVEKAGYGAKNVDLTIQNQTTISAKKAQEQSLLKRDLIIAFLLTLPIFILEMGSHFIPGMHGLIAKNIGMQNSWYIQFILASLVLIFPGRRFLSGGLRSLWHFAPDMNSLVSVGTSAAYLYSLIATFTPQVLPPGTTNVYFEAATMIIVLILLGKFLEAKAKGQTSEAIKHLVSLQTKTAHVLQKGNFVDLPIEKINIGDIVEVRPGEKIPVDGCVTIGQSYVNEAMITGESMPIEKTIGSSVIAGTINQAGALTIETKAVGNNTMLSQIIRLVEQAQGSKMPIQAIVDKVTLWFVPLVMLAAVVTFLIWFYFGPTPTLTYALVNAVAVLIVACPCAMGLATPTSIMVGTGKGAEMGILFRQGEALQSLKGIKAIALDKTGTITEGKPTLTNFVTTDKTATNKILSYIAAVEAHSEHPIAKAIVSAAQEKSLTIPEATSFESITGMGVRAMVNGKIVEIGAEHFMQELKISCTRFSTIAKELAQQGKTPLYAVIDQQLVAIIAVADPIKESSFLAINSLHKQKLKVAMITGDNQLTAKSIANQLNIDDVTAEVLPAGKIKAIEQLKKKYQNVAFVGDGINDAPALAAADVSIAIGTGTDIAIESAHVVLISGNLQGVTNAIALSQATIKNIHQNLFWAFAYNILLIPIAAGVLFPFNGVLISPIFAACAMALSSVFVLVNALRLKYFKPKKFIPLPA